MSKQSFSMNYLFPFFIIIILSVGCNNNGADKSKAATEPAATDKAIAEPSGATFIGKLDTLWIDSSAFANPADTNKFVFAFTLGGNDTLTLTGWNARGKNEDSFVVTHKIILFNGGSSGISYGPGTYFANVILRKNDLKKIKLAISTTHDKYVVFVPKNPDGHISYEILVTNDDPRDKTKTMALTSTATANPSPPKNY